MALIRRIHGILFVAGMEGVSVTQLCDSLHVDKHDIEQTLQQLKLNLQHDEQSPIELVNFNGQYRLVTKPDLKDDVAHYAQLPFAQKLTRAAIETLAIIAYRQPITRMGIDEIRGVASSHLLQKLMMRDLIQEVGRLEAPGRPVLYGVTDYFMDYFGLASLEELPDIAPLLLNEEPTQDELFSTKKWHVQAEEEWEKEE